MPELPEVEFARRCWQRWAGDRTVLAVTAQVSRVLRPHRPQALAPLKGATFFEFQRRGKNLLFTARRKAAPVGVWSHLGMTGKWLRRSTGAEPPRFSRARIDLDDGHSLFYCDMRLFGRLQLVPAARFEDIAELRALGPDPLADGIDVGRLHERLQATRLPVKVALLDQRLLAGIGNIQASEALYRAGIDPRRPAKSLDRAEARRLAAGIRASLTATLKQFEHDVGDGDILYVEEPGTPNPFAVYDRAGQPCRRCKRGKQAGTIERIVQAGRSTYFCPRCQK
jgi:formamidopyrimidine-DNA glycosylase